MCKICKYIMNSIISPPYASMTNVDEQQELSDVETKYFNENTFCWKNGEFSDTMSNVNVEDEGHSCTSNSVDSFQFMDSSQNCLDPSANKHFSYYSTDSEKLMKHLDLNGVHQQSYPCAFHSWSPIYGPIKVIPTSGLPFNSVPFASKEANNSDISYHQSQFQPVTEKLSYSDALTKSPNIKLSQDNNSSASKSRKPDKIRRIKSTSSTLCKEHNAMEAECDVKNPTKLPHDHSSPKPVDSKILGTSNTQCNNCGEDLDEIELLPNNKNTQKSNKVTEPINNDEKSDLVDENKATKKEQSPKNTLNNLQNTQKISHKRLLNYNNNLSSSWQESKYNCQFKPKVKNTKDVSSNEASSLGKKTFPENDSKKPSSFHKKSSTDKNSKSVTKKGTKKYQKSETSGMDWSPVSSYAQICLTFLVSCINWLLELILDVLHMSAKLGWHLFQLGWNQFLESTANLQIKAKKFPEKILSYIQSKYSKQKSPSGSPNISFPVTRDAAMKRLLSCKGKDPYSIIGVSPLASDEEIKKYYRRQAFLVHPDKNPTPGAEEAFKILVQAFELIGEPEKRQKYDNKVMEAQQFESAWNEFSDLINKLHEKMEAATNSIKCTSCGKCHHRIKLDRPCYGARYCSSCKTFHAARDGDIWAESKMFGFRRRYFACMESSIFDVTEWAVCQSVNLKHLKANHHNIQYRIISNKRSPTTEDIPSSADPNLDQLFNAFQGKKTTRDTTSSSSTKQDVGKRKKSKKKR